MMKPGDLYKTKRHVFADNRNGQEEEIPAGEVLFFIKKKIKMVKRYSCKTYDRTYTFLWNEKEIDVLLVRDQALKWFWKINK